MRGRVEWHTDRSETTPSEIPGAEPDGCVQLPAFHFVLVMQLYFKSITIPKEWPEKELN